MPKKLDLVGKEFGWLVVQKKTDKRTKSNGSIIWECLCKCGKIVHSPTYHLIGGETKSCGCYKRKVISVTLKELWKSGKPKDTLKFYEGTEISKIKSKKPQSNNTSGVRGVHWNKRLRKWQASIKFKHKPIYLGVFVNKEDAINARKRAEEVYYEPLIEKYG